LAILLFIVLIELPWALVGLLKPYLWIGGIAGLIIALNLEFTSRRPRPKQRTGKCHWCGYDLRGNVSGICPECGTQIQKERALRRPPILKTMLLGSNAGVWLRRRLLYRNLLVAFCALIAFYFTPNRVIFGKLTSPSPKDFVDDVNTYFAPVVRAAYAYERDTGHLPSSDLHELVPGYLPSGTPGFLQRPNQFFFFARFNSYVIYDFNPGQDAWRVEGYVHGRIPAAPIFRPPFASTQPTTKP
jgi:hypothetical protein